MDLQTSTIKQLHKGLVEKDFSAGELCQFFLDQIDKKERQLGAFLETKYQLSQDQAKQVDEKISRGEEISLLAGIPCGIKDNILTKGYHCTAGSKMLENYQAVYDATCIEKLREQGSVFLGKTNMDEFAMGSSTEHSAFKPTKNPHDKERVPGGSSGGSAAGVASGEAVFALGSDTGGSIRQPASFCGIVGLKPTYGAVSRYGLIAFGSSLDQIGPLAKNVEDAEIVFNAIVGIDDKDSTSVDVKSKCQNLNVKIQNIRIGVPKEYFGEGIDKGVRDQVERAIKKAEKEGAKIEEISLPNSKYALACYYIVATSEASANLARFDGIRYGLSKSGDDLFGVYMNSKEAGFGDEVKRRIMLGTFALSSGYYDAYYLKAQKVRALIKQDFDKAFEKVDFIFTPVSPFVAFKFDQKMNDPLQMYLSDIYTISINLAGLPAISLPCGKADNMPVGLQIIGKHFDESGIFSIAKEIERLV